MADTGVMNARRTSFRLLTACIACIACVACVACVAAAAAIAAGPAAAQGVKVPIKVFHGRDGSAAALVELRIGTGHGYFVIDTGAEKSLIDSRVAKLLHLRAVGHKQRFCGVGGCDHANRLVQVRDWSIGGLTLPATRMAQSRFLQLFPGSVIAAGLLGADVLSAYGKVNIDWAAGVMTLGDGTPAPPPAPAPKQPGADSGGSSPTPGNPGSPGSGIIAFDQPANGSAVRAPAT